MVLPIELIDHIFAFLSFKSHLPSCSLVCSSWTDTAHRHLFHKLVYTRRVWESINYSVLLSFLQDKSSIATHVRMLDLVGGERTYQAIVEPHVFSALLRTLPNLKHVLMDSITLSYTIEDETTGDDGCGDRVRNDDGDERWNWDRDIDEKSTKILVGSGRCLESLRIEIVSHHPCREKKVTVICAASESFPVRNDVERVIREELADLDMEGCLEVVQEYTEWPVS
ncbi:hypothetical protein NLI96_g9118 [Meripilus lineatus]|uniref:F-box domain-containing protein n=1 Tax=Meripilus lineatus TaxID=2056292 RepID=A0AAD5UXS7_9APHY|nr:hypothetical protein NLI96_g9118 [Physisporinus lineatus]